MMSWKSLFFYYFSRYVNVHNICKRVTVLQMVTKLYVFSVACALPSEVRTKGGEDWMDTLERENKVRTSVKSLRWDIQDIQPATEYREQAVCFTHHIQWALAPTLHLVTARPVPKVTKPSIPDKTI